jgi:hypothetical protein
MMVADRVTRVKSTASKSAPRILVSVKVHPFQIALAHVAAIENGIAEVGRLQARFGKNGIGDQRTRKIGTGEVRTGKIGIVELAADESGMLKFRPEKSADDRSMPEKSIPVSRQLVIEYGQDWIEKRWHRSDPYRQTRHSLRLR